MYVSFQQPRIQLEAPAVDNLALILDEVHEAFVYIGILGGRIAYSQ